jgi:hypothetical protein
MWWFRRFPLDLLFVLAQYWYPCYTYFREERLISWGCVFLHSWMYVCVETITCVTSCSVLKTLMDLLLSSDCLSVWGAFYSSGSIFLCWKIFIDMCTNCSSHVLKAIVCLELKGIGFWHMRCYFWVFMVNYPMIFSLVSCFFSCQQASDSIKCYTSPHSEISYLTLWFIHRLTKLRCNAHCMVLVRASDDSVFRLKAEMCKKQMSVIILSILLQHGRWDMINIHNRELFRHINK